MDARVKTTLMTLDVTHQVLATAENIDKLRLLKNNPAEQVANMMSATMEFDFLQMGLSGRAVHDACVPVYILRPDLFSPKPAYVFIEETPGECFGQSIISYYPRHVPEKPWIFVPNAINGQGVFDVILDRLNRYK